MSGYSLLSNKRPRSFINFWENFLSGRLILDRLFIFLWQMCHFRSGRLFILLYESGFFPTQVALILDRSFIFSSLVARGVVYLIRSSIEELRVPGFQGCQENTLIKSIEMSPCLWIKSGLRLALKGYWC